MSARPDQHRQSAKPPSDDLSPEEIVRRAARRGFDPARVANALGVELDPNRLELVRPDGSRARVLPSD
jgi:hypothetical protein